MEIHIGERVAEVQLVEKEGNQVRIAVDGQMYDVDIVIADNGVCSVIFNRSEEHTSELQSLV